MEKLSSVALLPQHAQIFIFNSQFRRSPFGSGGMFDAPPCAPCTNCALAGRRGGTYSSPSWPVALLYHILGCTVLCRRLQLRLGASLLVACLGGRAAKTGNQYYSGAAKTPLNPTWQLALPPKACAAQLRMP